MTDFERDPVVGRREVEDELEQISPRPGDEDGESKPGC